jgi:hypothetical protein
MQFPNFSTCNSGGIEILGRLAFLKTIGPGREDGEWVAGIPEPNVMRHCPSKIISIM